MRIIPFAVTAFVTVLLIVLLGTRMLLPAPLGALLSPQQGVWQNAEPSDINYSIDVSFAELKGKSEVYFDDRLVPHVFAEHDEDAYFIEGYLHAKFRLWQMEFQTHAAAGRLCEIMGEKSGTLDVLNRVDRYFRRLGMGYAAEKSLQLLEADTATKLMCDSYTAGVNAYIKSLTKGQLPLEYKLLGYQPEPWTNLKTVLFTKYMAYDLAGSESDFEYTAARNVLSKLDFETINPVRSDSLDPIIPKGTVFDKPGVLVKAPATADSLYFTYSKDSSLLPAEPQKPDKENGSNNWAVNGKKTRSGYPIVCNDPHLGLNLPSLWYEIQIKTPHFNVYGVSFPAAAGVIIGFNDSCAFGVTNAGRDVRDYYAVTFKDAARSAYLYNGEWKQTEFRYEHIKIKGKPDFIDTVAYTVFGPVIFDARYSNRTNDGKNYAVRWKAHDASNEMKMFYQLDRAKNYNDYLEAIKNLHTPGQNCVFAAKNGDIAIWCQGEFPAKWKRQGDFIMPGTDSSYRWQGIIPQSENPHQLNPERGFVSSANQLPADTSYPYYIGGSFPNYRGWTINKRLSQMADITPQDMMELQTNNYNVFAEMARPVLLKNMNEGALNADEKKYWVMLKEWNLRSDTAEAGPVVFTTLWDSLEKEVWADEVAQTHSAFSPYQSTLLEGLLRDAAYKYVDNINTPQKETLADDLLAAFKKIIPVLKKAEVNGKLDWAKFKDTHVSHLTKLPALSRLHLPIGGGTHIINAAKTDHGPSWRMIVSLTPETEAYGVYPGGQNGNPGSKYYDSFIDNWANGKYYPLWVMKNKDSGDKRVKFRMVFSNN
jgi:penicillin G amidase